jgi:hypothetical protein
MTERRTPGGLYVGDPDPTCPGLEIPGWMTEKEMRWLHEQAKNMNGVVEVGCLIGRSSAALLSACQGPVYCIDCWTGDNAGGKTYFKQNVGHYPNLNLIHDYSHNVVDMFTLVDMVFLDGDHTYESISEDINDWLPKTTVLFCGHDYGHPDYPGVKQRVDEVFPGKFQVYESIWWLNP